jgi:hypothetical protein
VQLESEEAALTYYEDNLAAPIARQRGDFLGARLQEFGIAPESIDVQWDDPNQALSIVTLEAVEAAVQEHRVLGFWGPTFSTDFYEHINEGGSKFTLGSEGRTYHGDPDLSRLGWDNRISSVDTGTFVVVTLLCDLSNYRGSKLWLFTDESDLTRRHTSHGTQWNDLTSSCAVSKVGVQSLMAALRI